MKLHDLDITKKIRRKSWGNEKYNVYSDGNTWLCSYGPEKEYSEYIMQANDLMATDWEYYPGQKFQFSEIIKDLKPNTKIRAIYWASHRYVYLNNKGFFVNELENLVNTIDNMHCDWEYYKEPIKTYYLKDLLTALQHGELVTRLIWPNEKFLRIHENIFHIAGSSDGLKPKDLAASDWHIKD